MSDDNETTNNGHPIGQVSMEAKLLHQRLAKAELGELVTYEELSRICGRNVQHEGRGVLNTARKRAQHYERAIFGVVKGQGVKRLDDSGIVQSAASTLDHIRRTAKREARKQTCVDDFDGMAPEDKARHNATIAICGTLAAFTAPKAVARLEQRVGTARELASVDKTLDLFRSKDDPQPQD